jgi:hypothetical protein
MKNSVIEIPAAEPRRGGACIICRREGMIIPWASYLDDDIQTGEHFICLCCATVACPHRQAGLKLDELDEDPRALLDKCREDPRELLELLLGVRAARTQGSGSTEKSRRA